MKKLFTVLTLQLMVSRMAFTKAIFLNFDFSKTVLFRTSNFNCFFLDFEDSVSDDSTEESEEDDAETQRRFEASSIFCSSVWQCFIIYRNFVLRNILLLNFRM